MSTSELLKELAGLRERIDHLEREKRTDDISATGNSSKPKPREVISTVKALSMRCSEVDVSMKL